MDDDDEMLRLLRGLLGAVCEIADASNGLDGLCLLQRLKPRLMLLDLSMPEMDGLEVLAAALRVAPSMPVVILTGDADVDSAVTALNKGAAAYVTKPFDPGSLREEVARLAAPPGRPGDAPWQLRGD